MIAAMEQRHSTDTVSTDLAVASLESVNKNYGDVRALRGVNFQVRAGELVIREKCTDSLGGLTLRERNFV